MINPLEAMVALTLLIWALAVWGSNSHEDEEGTTGDKAAEARAQLEEPPSRSGS